MSVCCVCCVNGIQFESLKMSPFVLLCKNVLGDYANQTERHVQGCALQLRDVSKSLRKHAIMLKYWPFDR